MIKVRKERVKKKESNEWTKKGRKEGREEGKKEHREQEKGKVGEGKK